MFTCVCRSRSRLENDDLAMMNDVIGVGWHYYAPFSIETYCVNIIWERCVVAQVVMQYNTAIVSGIPGIVFRVGMWRVERERFYQWR